MKNDAYGVIATRYFLKLVIESNFLVHTHFSYFNDVLTKISLPVFIISKKKNFLKSNQI